MLKYLIIMPMLLVSSYPAVSVLNNPKAEKFCFWGDINETDVDKDIHRDYGNWQYCNYPGYFENLNHNFGNNEMEATCCYVALSTLLTYYDCVFDDDLVSSSRSVYGNLTESFGTNFEPNCNLSDSNVAGYYNHLRNYKNSGLHSYLILRDKGALISNPSTMANNMMGEFGNNSEGMEILANDYLTNVVGLGTSDFYLTEINSLDGVTTYSDFISFIDNNLYQGKPVLVGFDGHATVVYGYSDNKYIYHNGYDENLTNHQTRKYIDKSFFNLEFLSNHLVGALSINFSNYSHHHAYNYTDDNITYYCVCGAQQHVHDYTHHYVDNNANNHRSYCACGAYINEVHDFLIYFFDNPCRCGRYR